MQTVLMTGQTTTATGSSAMVQQTTAQRTYQATVLGSGAQTATVIVEGSNENINFLTLGTITLSGTTTASDGFASEAAWVFVRARLTAISGTGATVTVVMGS